MQTKPLGSPLSSYKAGLTFGLASPKANQPVPNAVFKLLSSVYSTSLHDHEGGGADRSFLRYSLIKGILKGSLSKLIIKPLGGQPPSIIRLEDEYDALGHLTAKSAITKIKEETGQYNVSEPLEFQWRSKESRKHFYEKYINDPQYLQHQFNQYDEHLRLRSLADELSLKAAKSNKQTGALLQSTKNYHEAQARQIMTQLDRYVFYKRSADWFWTEFLSTDALKLYFRYYENLEQLLANRPVEEVLDYDAMQTADDMVQNPRQLREKLDKIQNFQNTIYRWSQGDGTAEKELAEAYKRSRSSSLSDYRKTSAIINPAVKKLDVANYNAYNFLNRLAKENIRYAEYRVSLTGNDIGDTHTYYYDANDKLWAVASGLQGAQSNNARWGIAINYGITVLIERQPKLTADEQRLYQERLVPETNRLGQVVIPADTPQQRAAKRAYKINKAVEEAHRSVDLALAVKRAAHPGDPRSRITSFDLAGDEANYPVDVFAPVFEKIHAFNREMLAAGTPEKRVGITIHAGEEPASSDAEQRHYQWSESIQKAYEVGYREGVTPFRIGHGVMLWAAPSQNDCLKKAYAEYLKNPRQWVDSLTPQKVAAIEQATPLIHQLKTSGVGIELCPKSNVQTGAVPYYTLHPALFYLALGLKVSVNTDNRTISNTDTANELVKLHKHLGLRWHEVKQLLENGVDTAFIFNSDEREALKEQINQRLDEIEQTPQQVLGRMLLDGYQPTQYVYGSGSSINAVTIKKQQDGQYPVITPEAFKEQAYWAENNQRVAAMRAIHQQAEQLKQ
ncbi:MAG: hypothetical protein U0003_01940 [Vampirovibrionales bacterium]